MMLVGDAALTHNLPFSDLTQMAAALGTIYGPMVRNIILMLI